LTPFYLLLSLAGLLVLALLLSLARGRGARLRGEPFRRRALLSSAEQRCYRLLVAAVGEDYLICPKVAPHALLQPLTRLGRKQRRLAEALLQQGTIDMVICAVADAYPLAAVRLDAAGQSRWQRRIASRLQAALAAAGIPVVELSLTEPPSIERLHALVQEAVEMSEVRVVPRPESVAQDDEAALLSQLSAAMQDSGRDHQR
jgi:hypothetical protein